MTGTTLAAPQKVAVIGAGWAGCAAAVEAVRRGHRVTLLEAARVPGGRARRVPVQFDGQTTTLDNGQHILIGAYADTLQLMTDVGVDPEAALLRLPLTLQFPAGFPGQRPCGLRLPNWPAPLDALFGIAMTSGWSWADKLSLLKQALRWQKSGFTCEPAQTVASLCREVSPRILAQLIEPLCVSALNTPAHQASGAVFLKVLQDSMFAARGGSNLLLPRVDLSALLPDAAVNWLRARSSTVHLGERVLKMQYSPSGGVWQVQTSDLELFDRVVLACPPQEAARLISGSGVAADDWLAQQQSLSFEAITTVYAHAPRTHLPLPLLALASSGTEPAQFVFDRGQLDGPAGLLAFVVSASLGDGPTLTTQVLEQGIRQLRLPALHPVQTIVEKRATFACTPGLQRPSARVAPGLVACGDYIAGPYPATLEGAVRSGLSAARLC